MHMSPLEEQEWQTHRTDGVECGISTNAEVRARNIVGHCGRDDHERDTELIKLLSALHQLQASSVCLMGSGGQHEVGMEHLPQIRGDGNGGAHSEAPVMMGRGHSPQSPQ